jgi:hypothetical protein
MDYSGDQKKLLFKVSKHFDEESNHSKLLVTDAIRTRSLQVALRPDETH